MNLGALEQSLLADHFREHGHILLIFLSPFIYFEEEGE